MLKSSVPSLLNIIAHRCNTLDTIAEAVRLHQQGLPITLECDVRTTADHILVAHHNTHHQGRSIRKTRFCDLGRDVLPLEKVLDRIGKHGLRVHLDVKASCLNGHWLAAAQSNSVFELLKSKALLDSVVVTTVKGQFLVQLRQMAPRICLGVLYDEDYGERMPPNREAVNLFIHRIVAFHRRIGLDAVFLNQHWLHVFDEKYHVLEKFFYALVKAGIKIAVWTVNTPGCAQRFTSLGAHWITTDRPKIIHRHLSQT